MFVLRIDHSTELQPTARNSIFIYSNKSRQKMAGKNMANCCKNKKIMVKKS